MIRSFRGAMACVAALSVVACDSVTSPEAARSELSLEYECVIPAYTLQGNPCLSVRIETRPSSTGTLATVWIRNDQGTSGLPGGELSLAIRGFLWMIPGNPLGLDPATNRDAGETVLELDGGIVEGEGRPWGLSYWRPGTETVATRFFIVDPNTAADQIRSIVGCDRPSGGIIGALLGGYYQTCSEDEWIGFRFESPFQWSAEDVIEIGAMVDIALGPASIITGICGRPLTDPDAYPDLNLSDFLCALEGS